MGRTIVRNRTIAVFRKKHAALAVSAANSYEWPVMQAKGMYFEYPTANLRLKYKQARRRRSGPPSSFSCVILGTEDQSAVRFSGNGNPANMIFNELPIEAFYFIVFQIIDMS